MNSVIKTSWKKIVSVTPGDNFTLEIEIEGGEKRTIHCKSLIQKRESFWRLRRPRYFKQVGIDPLGGLFWPEGEDISPEAALQL